MTQRFLTDLADVLRAAGLRVIEIDGWKTRGRPPETGDFDPHGALWHHTGASDRDPESTMDDREYAVWLATVGRPDLPPPLCQLSTGRDGTVYVCAAGRANHAGVAKAVGPMPSGDGNAIYLGNEVQNNGIEGIPAAQLAAMVRTGAALDAAYGWPASHNRAHWETSITGKWDIGDPEGIPLGDKRVMDMDKFRALIITEENTMQISDGDIALIAEASAARTVARIRTAPVDNLADSAKPDWSVNTALNALYDTTHRTEDAVRELSAQLDRLTAQVVALTELVQP